MRRSPRRANSRPMPWPRSPSRGNRHPMYRIILFLVLIALAAAGAAWIADQTGDVTLSWGGWRVQTSLPVFVLALGVAIVAGGVAGGKPRAVGPAPKPQARAAGNPPPAPAPRPPPPAPPPPPR